MKTPPQVQALAALFAGAGKDLYLVGGAVRDILRGKRAHDWDLATSALPGEVIDLVEHTSGRGFVVPTGIKHGTVTVHFRGLACEVTTFRAESGYSDGRRPDQVAFGVSLEDDLARRDFTMNAVAYKLPGGPLVDPFHGEADIRARLIRSVGDPAERFAEDGLRPLRALRFVSQLGFAVDGPVLAAIPGALGLTARVAAERVREEFDKIIASPAPKAALDLMETTGLLGLLLPELAACRGVDQKGFHRFDVLDHSLLACAYASREGFPPAVRLAALFHDLGKPETRRLDEERGVWTFYHHEQASVRLTRTLMTRLRYPNGVIDRVCHLIGEHMFHYTGDWSDAAVRRFVARVGEEYLDDLYRLRRADAFGMTAAAPGPELILPLMNRVDDVLAQGKALTLKDLAVSGDDLRAAGIPPGKRMGVILRELLEAVMDDPGLNSREKLLEIAGRLG